MKKVIYSIFSVSVLLFASCNTEDRGTSTEVANSNNKENVNPNHIRGFGGEDKSRISTTTDVDYMASAHHIVEKMATDLQLDEATQKRVVTVIADREQRLAELEESYGYTETARMGGQAHNDTEVDRNANQNTTMDPIRKNNAGNVYEEGSAMSSETAKGMEQQASTMSSQHSQIMANADKELKSILSAEQYSKYVKNRSKYVDEAQQNSVGGGSGTGYGESGGNQMNNSGSNNQMNNSGTNNQMNNSGSNNMNSDSKSSNTQSQNQKMKQK